METLGSSEAKTHLPRLLDRVVGGESITITRHGVPVATLVPVQPAKARDAGAIIEELRRLRKGRKLKGLKIRRLIEVGRR
jgi:prevent-host-death family protein